MDWRTIPTAIALTILLAGLFLIRSRVSVGWFSRSWPQVSGVVVETGCVLSGFDDSGDPLYDGKVIYRYVVAGREYRGNSIEALPELMGKEQAGRIAELYPPGKDVAVYYDPEDPRRSVLVPGLGGWTQLGLLIYVAVCVMLAIKLISGPD